MGEDSPAGQGCMCNSKPLKEDECANGVRLFENDQKFGEYALERIFR